MDRERARMIEGQLVRRGITDARVLAAFRALPREAFVPPTLGDLAYEDSPLPIGEGQTISQPYVVALTLQALDLGGGERVLEIGTGSGYAAALLGRLARDVWTVERIASLADAARARLAEAGVANVHVVCGDGSLGLPERAPFEAIAVAAAGPRVPHALREQLAIGGRLVMPVGSSDGQHLVRVTRRDRDVWDEERLLDVTFVPLIGVEAWPERGAEPPQEALLAPPSSPVSARSRSRSRSVPGPHDDGEVASIVRRYAEAFARDALPARDLSDRIGDARVVVLGGSLDGSAELQRARAQITWELVSRRGFSLVAVEGDWSDGACIDDHVRARQPRTRLPLGAFARFPEFRYRNAEVSAFVDALAGLPDPPSFHGLDMLGTTAAVAVALERLDELDTERADDARRRWATLSPWRRGVADLLDGETDAAVEEQTIGTLVGMLAERVDPSRAAGRRVRDAVLRACEGAEVFYRHLLRGALDAWSMRERHMFAMLRALLADRGPRSRAVVWANDAHVADAAATETGVRGHATLGQLCRAAFGRDATLVGMGADHGAILASAGWGERAARVRLEPAAPRSYERLFHELGLEAFVLPLRDGAEELREALATPRLARCVGPIYRAERELSTQYLYVSLPSAFDAYVFFDRSSDVQPLAVHATADPDLGDPLHA